MASNKRRGRGEGSIYRRNDGRWVANATVGYTPTGQRKRRDVYGRTKQEVQEKLQELQHQKATGTLTDASKMTAAQWLEHWLEKIAKPKLRPLTYRSYESIIRKRLIPHIGRIQLTKLSPVHLHSMQTELSALAASTRVKTHAVLRKSLSVAMRQGLVIRNVCDAVEQPRGAKPEMKTLTAEHADALISAAEATEYGALIVLAIATGLRQGELFGRPSRG